jgi:inorganic triphosphatase YgiF
VKTCAASSGAARGEWEAPVKGGSPDRDLLRGTPAAAALAGLSLEPLFTVIVERQTVTSIDAGSTIEVSLDRGVATHGARSTSFGELELELKSGDPAALFAFAGGLRKAFALRPGFTTKADRGFALMDKKGPPGRRFRAPVLERKMTADNAFRAIAMAALKQIAGNAEDLRERPAAEVIHQMRIGARRLQSTLFSFKPIVSDQRMDGLKAELTWLLGELDLARNLDVFLAGAFSRASRARGDKEGLAALGKRLRTARKAAYVRARNAAECDRFSALLLDILTWMEVGPWTEAGGKAADLRDAPISQFAANALEKARRGVRKRARSFDDLSREGRHKLRIRTKTLRYSADVFQGLFKVHPKRVRRFSGKIKALLECLGALNDVATGENLLAEHAVPKCLTDRQASREKRLIGSARRAWDAFGETKRFWPKQT